MEEWKKKDVQFFGFEPRLTIRLIYLFIFDFLFGKQNYYLEKFLFIYLFLSFSSENKIITSKKSLFLPLPFHLHILFFFSYSSKLLTCLTYAS